MGKGAFGEVVVAIHKATGDTRALKKIPKKEMGKSELDSLMNEVNVLKQLVLCKIIQDHPNILKLYACYNEENIFWIASELCTGGEIFNKILNEGSFSEKAASLVFRQVLSAVTYCHSYNIVHRDLKPENLLLESSKEDALIKVIDFGTSCIFYNNKKFNKRFGTPYYIAPEVLKRNYDEKCDIWSLGVILYIFLCGYPPFNGKNDEEILEAVKKGEFSFLGDEWNHISNEAKSFISEMLTLNPENRVSGKLALQDPWFKKYASNDIVEIPIISQALQNMREFRAEEKLQEAIWTYIVTNLCSKDEQRDLLRTFQALDLNGDGQLSKDELFIGYSKLYGETKAREEVDKIMKRIDNNHSGTIDYTEFVIATISKEKMLTKSRLETAFSLIDKDKSGCISINEFKEIFGGVRVDDSIWHSIIQESDENGDGEISLQEFKDMMMRLLDNSKAKTLEAIY